MYVRTDAIVATAMLAGALFLGACGSSEKESSASQAPASAPNPEMSGRIQTDVELASPGQRVTLLRFTGLGRLEASCGERPRVAFRVADKAGTAGVGVDVGRRRRGKVRTLDPGERLATRLASSALARWHVGSRHGDGDRVLTASVQVTPVVGGRGSCMFTAQSIRTGRIP
jgi:hypothetical protein